MTDNLPGKGDNLLVSSFLSTHGCNPIIFQEFWSIIKACDAILVLNYTRRWIENHIGENTFLEMRFAHVLNKRIFLMNPIPDMQLYRSEIEAMKPEIIYEDLSKVGKEC